MYKCKIFTNIENWNVKNFDTFRDCFKGCKSLEKLPDISKWKTSNVIDACIMFDGCESESLKELPDINKWDTSKLKSIEDMFKDYKLFEGKIPDKFKTKPKENNNEEKK